MMPTPGRDQTRKGLSLNPVTIILVCAVGLCVIGLTILFSASVSYKQGPYYYLSKQIIWLGLSIGVAFVTSRIDLEYVRKYVWWITGFCLFGLLLVLIPHIGITVKGSRRWLGFGPMRLQISEFAKLALVFALAHYLAINQSRLGDVKKGFLIPMAGIGLFCVLIIREPDFGTALLTGTIGIMLMFLAGARLRYLVPTFALALTGFAAMVIHNPNRLRRIVAFMDPEGSRDGAGYQNWQALLALAAGGMDGAGLGQGRQQMNFLPEAHTDFILAVVGEELGLIGTLTVAVLFITIFIAGLMHLRKAPNLFQFLLVAGCLLLICLQSIINLGVVTSLLPNKGMSLPFISAGGSNLLLMGLLLGILVNTQRSWSSPKVIKTERSFKEVLA